VIHLSAPTVMRVPAAELSPRSRERFGGELRRAGGYAQLCLLGAQACLDAARPGGSLGVLWSSSRGPVSAVRAVLAEAASGEPVMPFSFVAIQPHLAATILAQRGANVARAAFVRIEDDAWPWLLAQAMSWLGTCDRVLLGRVEEGDVHQSDWCLLQRDPPGITCEPLAKMDSAIPTTAEDWLARVAASSKPLMLSGGGEGWRFSATRA
jgi:hypothetical protein